MTNKILLSITIILVLISFSLQVRAQMKAGEPFTFTVNGVTISITHNVSTNSSGHTISAITTEATDSSGGTIHAGTVAIYDNTTGERYVPVAGGPVTNNPSPPGHLAGGGGWGAKGSTVQVNDPNSDTIITITHVGDEAKSTVWVPPSSASSPPSSPASVSSVSSAGSGFASSASSPPSSPASVSSVSSAGSGFTSVANFNAQGVIWTNSGEPEAFIDRNGNMYLEGTLYPSNTGDGRFKIKCRDSIVASIDSAGNLYLRGNYLPESPQDQGFVVKSNGVVKAQIDCSGNLRLEGNLYKGVNVVW